MPRVSLLNTYPSERKLLWEFIFRICLWER